MPPKGADYLPDQEDMRREGGRSVHDSVLSWIAEGTAAAAVLPRSLSSIPLLRYLLHGIRGCVGQHLRCPFSPCLRRHYPTGDELVRANVKKQQTASVHSASVGNRRHTPQFRPRLLENRDGSRVGQSRER